LEVGKPARAREAPGTKPAAEKKPSDPKMHSRLALLGAGFAALIVIAAGAWYFLAANRSLPVTSSAPPPAGAARLSIAVLPFANLSGAPAPDYLADALSSQLTTAIARLHDSFVIAHSSALTYKGKPVD